MLIMLLTLGVGQMWAGNAGYVGNGESYFKNYLEYSKDGGSATQFKVDGSGQSDLNLGVVTSLTLTQYGVGMYQNEDNLNGNDYDKFCYWIHQKDDDSESWTDVTGNWADWDTYGWSSSWRHPGFGNNDLDIDVLDGLGAGEYKLTFYFKHQGNSNWGNNWLYLSNGGDNYNITFTIDPVVTFKANGGTGSDYTQRVTYNTNTALTANTFTKTGYTFAGWATSSGGDVVYADGANVKLTAHTDLYAKWLPQSLTITSYPTYLTTTDHMTLGINYANIPSGYCYRVKVGAGYYNNSSNQDRDAISGSGSTSFTSYAYLPTGNNTVVVELWKDSPFEKQSVVSDGVTVTVEQAYLVNVRAYTDGVESTAGGTVSPASVNASLHIGQTITASEPTTGYDFTGWTANTPNITFANASARTTTVYATAGGTVYANYVRQSGSYSTTFYAGDHGSIRVIDTDIAKNGNATVTTGENETLSATPESAEYVFDHWGTTGSVSVASATSASTTVTATAAGGTVTAYYRHVPELGAVTASPSGQQNYAGSPIDFALSVTSTYMAHPVVVFLVNDGTTTYEVVGAPYGADGSSAAGTIGSDAAYTTVHKATFTASAAKSYTVSAKLYEGLLLANWDGKDFTGGTGWEGSNGHDLVTNPSKQAVNGSNNVRRFTKGANYWDVDLYRFAAKNAGISTFRYAHTRQYRTETGKTWLKLNDDKGDLQKNDDLSTNTWQKVVYDNGAGTPVDFFFPLLKEGNTNVYFDDIILSNEASMTEKASQAATASFSINWNYTVTLNNNGATTAGTESVNVTYGSALSDITVPTKTGYTFYGYYTADGGAGTLQINASGVWQNGGYVSGGNWNSGSNQTLYAKWGENPSLTELELSSSLVTTDNTFTATPTIDTGDGRTTIVCWDVQTAAGVKLDPQPSISPEEGNAVTITAPAAPGSYKVVATLKEGTECEGTVLNSLQRSFTVEGSYTVTITNGSGSSSVGEVTTATATANAAAAGMKFDHWNVTGTISYTSGDVNSRTITFNASSNISLTAVYTERDTKKVYFAKPSGWSKVYAYAWQNSETSNKNGEWAATEITANTETVKGTTYHYYEYSIDDNGETGGDKTNQNAWDRIIFHNGDDPGTAQSTKTADLTLVDGHFYHIADGSGESGRSTATVSGSASAEDWYVCGYWNQSTDDWGFAHPVDLNGSTTGNVAVTVTASRTQEFKIYRASTNEWFKWTGGPSADYYDNYAALIGDPMTLRIYNANRNTFTSYATEYLFTLDITSTSNPVLTLVPNENTPYSATLSKNGHGSLSVGTGAITLKQYIPTTITATPEPGYRFTGWTTTGSVAYAGGTSSSDATASFIATASDGTITANFSNEGIVYFDRSAVNGTWSGDKVYVTYFTSAGLTWDEGDGSGNTGALVVKNWINDDVHNQEMTRIPNSNIYYFYTSRTPQGKILFTDKSHAGSNYKLYEMGAVVREDFNVGQDNMFVVENYNVKDKNKVGYCDGYWMKYQETSSGIELQVFDEGEHAISGSPVTFTTTRAGDRQYEASITLSAATAYKFKVKSFCGTWYGNSGTMTNTNCTGWDFLDRVGANCYFRSTGAGTYKFTLNCTDEGKLKVSLEFPLDVNDYRVVYQGKVKEGGSATHHPSEFIRHLSAAGERKDTISFYVREDWSLQLQQCSAVSPTVTWGNVGAAISKATLGITENGVYTFYVTQTHNGTTNTVTIEKGEEYTGDYYIRSSAAGGGWEAYQTTPDNKLVHSDFSKVHSGYDYYHCHYVTTGQNVKFCIANDYSTNITDTLDNDTYVTSYGNLPYECSVRFMYNNAKNTISRAYLNGSYDGSTEYLALYSKAGASTDSIKNIDDSAIDKAGGINHVKFQDMGNWVYQKDIKALPGTRVRLISNYRFSNTDHLQYFKGSAGDWDASTTEQLIGGTTNDWQKLRLVYDFKTNHLIGAWLVPDRDIPEGGLIINADVMIIRTDQGDAEQITFGDPKDKLDKVNVIYSTLHLTYNHIANKKKTDNTTDSTLTARSQREYYWVSFPYDVKIEDIFGSVGEFNNEWGIMYYDGKERAEKGYWADSESFWKYFPDRSATLKAFEGYVVGVDIDMVGQAVDKGKWVNGVRDVYLYFPSDTARSIVNRDTTITIDQEGYECTIDRRTDKTVPNVDKDRRIADSYWHCIGVPSFHNVSHTIKNNWIDPGTGRDVMIPNISDWETPDVPYLYVWNPVLNNYTPQAATSYTFKAMHSYMVQYNRDTIKWSAVAAPEAPAAIAARKVRKMENGDIEWRIDLMRDDESQDRTYVRMSNDESVTSGFEFNYDLTKELNANKANIYTFADYVPVAGNMMPMSTTETTIVPVGVKIPANGLYTFTMPEGTEGVGVVLIDNIAGTRTNLALEDYTVNLTAGKIENRFFLEISPIVQSPTDIEHTSSDSKDGVRKVMVDGVLYIVKEGVVFDACGNRVK